MVKQRLIVHIGYNGKKIKTELIFFPSITKLKEWRSESTSIVDVVNIESIEISILKKSNVNLEVKYNKAVETRLVIVDEKGRKFEFNTQFTYLVSILTFLMDDIVDIRYRITKAIKVMGVL